VTVTVYRPVTGLVTLQFAWGGLFDSVPADGALVHLVTQVEGGGTPGPTLCDIDRFAPGSPGWSVGGGVSGDGITHTPCPGCADKARAAYPGLPVVGSVGAKEMTAYLAALSAACHLVAVVGGTRYPCTGKHEDGNHHFAADLPDPCDAPFCRLSAGHRSLHDIPSGHPEVVTVDA